LVTADQNVITSTANPRIKDLARLHRRSERDQSGRFVVEGARELRSAYTAGVEIEQVVLCEELAGAEEMETAAMAPPDRILRVAPDPYARVSNRRHPDGLAGIARQFSTDLARFDPGPHPIVLVADGIEKPGNLGAVLRTADAAGAAVLVSDAATDLFNPRVVRASQGSLFIVPIAEADGATARAWAGDRLQLFVATPEASLPYWATDLTGPVGLVVGSEHRGVSDEWKDFGEHVSIPMAGTADSLNTSVTAALLLYEAVRQRAAPID
jgi:TrmH family RNA methyltransferase